ncbi:MAG TPA: glycosyltransferase [Conexibacter sp.]|nr:glycosyltransferase [Conexibacter sp.]
MTMPDHQATGAAAPYASLILPIHNQADHISRVVHGFLADFTKLDRDCELVLVPNGCSDASTEICAGLAAQHPDLVQLVGPIERGGWGRAINAGLEACRGEVVGYTNSARTTPETATLMLAYAIAYPETVLKAQRRIRESAIRRLGSVLYNFECRRLFDLATWDIDGTPKFFPRRFHHLMQLSSDAELYDLEWMRACRYAGYPVVEIPIYPTERFGGRSTTSYKSAVRMLVGAYRMRGSFHSAPPGGVLPAPAATGERPQLGDPGRAAA